MSGPLCQLAATGAQSNVLTGPNEFTPFKTQVRRMTAFAMEPKVILFNGQTAFGKTAVASISRQADLLHEVYLVVELSGLKKTTSVDGSAAEDRKLVQDLGRQMIEYVTLEAGSVVYETVHPDWMHMWEKITKNQDEISEHLTGHDVANDYGLQASTGDIPARRFYVPLKFFFSRTFGHSLPIVACHLTDIQIKVKLKRKEDLIHSVSGASTPTGELAIEQMFLLGEYVYLSDKERREVASNPHVFLIEQVQRDSFTIPKGSKSYKAELQFNHPCKSFYWYGVTGENVKNKKALTFSGDEKASTGKYSRDGDLFETASISLNNNVRVQPLGPKYYGVIQPMRHHSSINFDAGIYMYSFALYPEAVQPSGHLNCSRIEKMHLNLTFGTEIQSNEGTELVIFAQNYNIVRIKGGVTSLAWAS